MFSNFIVLYSRKLYGKMDLHHRQKQFDVKYWVSVGSSPSDTEVTREMLNMLRVSVLMYRRWDPICLAIVLGLSIRERQQLPLSGKSRKETLVMMTKTANNGKFNYIGFWNFLELSYTMTF